MTKASYITIVMASAIVFLLLHNNIFATKLTVDADGGSSYPTITAALNASVPGDTIYIQGSDIDSYDESWPTNRSPSLTIMSSFSNPDSFPVVRFSGGDWANYWQNGAVETTRFERIVMNNWATINLSNNQRSCIISKCVIKNFSSNVFTISGDHTNYLIITNSIFWNNTGTIFTQPSTHNNIGPYATIVNCTFFGNSTINAESNVTSTDVSNNKTVIIKNSVFKNNSTIATDTDIKPAYTYNLLPSGQSGWGTGSIYNDDPGFVNSSPAKASDFALLSNSPAKDVANNTGAPSTDIAGNTRSGTFDIGAFEYGSGGSSGTPDNYATWGYSTTITLNTTPSGANVSGNVLSFPVLIRLNPGNFTNFSQTLAAGADIRFAKTDGTHLPYQIERWIDGGSNNDTAEIWVKIDTVYGNNSTQSFKMYWGKAGAADSSSGTAVFAYGNNFLGAWHFAGNVINSRTGSVDGIDFTVDTGSGIIGRARAFDGASQYLQAGDMEDRPSGSVIFWFRPKETFNSSSSTTWGIWGKTENDNYNSNLSLRGSDFTAGTGGTGVMIAKIENNNSGVYINSNANSFTSGTWYHAAFIWGNNACSLYVNGVLENATSGNYAVVGAANDEVGRAYYDAAANISGSGPRYFKGTLDEFRIEKTNRTALWVKLCYQNQMLNQTLVQMGSQSSGNDYTWDNNSSSGIQTSSGTWGSDNYWTLTGSGGTSLVAWPGAGKSASFAGSDGTYTITVSGTQNVDSITFLNNGYTINGGTALNFGTKSGVYVENGKSATINSVVSGSPGLSKYGAGTLVLSGTNTFTGNTVINAGTLVVNNNNGLGNTTGTTTINGGSTPTILQLGNVTITGETITLNSDQTTSAISQIYVPIGTIATWNGTINFGGNYYNKIINNGTMNVQGTISGSGSGWIFLYIDGSGTGTLSSTVSIGSIHLLKNGTGTWTITSTGNTWGSTCVNNGVLKNGAANCLPSGTILVIGANDASDATYNLNGFSQTAGGITDGGTTGGTKQITNSGSASTLTVNNTADYTYSYAINNAISLVKNGSAKLTLAGTNTYTGTTSISAGNLCVKGSTASASAVTVASGATLSGNGTVSGTVTISNGGIITPGDGSSATLSTGALSLNSSSVMNLDLGSSSDRIAVSGNLILDGTLNITNGSGFGAGTYTIMTYSGSLTNNTLTLGSVPSGYDCSISASGGNVTVTVTETNPGNVVTVDADGPASYSSLDAALTAIQAGSIDPDTVKFVGSNQHTYSWTTTLDKAIGYIVFKSTQTNPDNFPIINHGSSDGYNFFNKTDAHFQRVIITGNVGFNLGQSAHSFSFKQCIIRDFSGTYAIHVEGLTGGTTVFENCLFEGNTCSNIFDLNYWGGTPAFTIINCTFDNNTSIWDEDEDQNTNFSLKNCIFSSNSTTFRGNNLRGKTTYSLTSEALTGYGASCVSNSNPQYVSGSRNNPSDWKLTTGTPADNIGTSTGAPGVDLGGNMRTGGTDAGCWLYDPIVNYFWDTSSTAGYQAGSGTWGTNNYWTSDGTTLQAWPGAGKSATFAGSDGTWTITINGTQNVDSIAFLNNEYTITGGTALNLSTKPGVLVNAGLTGSIITPITGAAGLSKYGAGTLILGGSSTFSGPVTINAGVVITSYLNNGGSSSNIGSSSNAASNLLFNGGTLKYTGIMQSSDRLFTLSTNGGTIDGSGVGALNFANTGAMGFSSTGTRTLTLTGSCTGNVLSLVVGDNSGATSIVKSGSGSWILSGNNTATGTVNISAGSLQIGNAGTSGSLSGAVINNGSLIFNRSNSYTYSGIISGSGTVTQAGAGTLILSGANTFSGNTSINSGILQLGAANTIPDGSGKGEVILYGTLDLNSYSEAINGLSGSGTVDNSAAGTPVLTIGGNNANSTFSGVIKNTAGTLGLTKTGSGIISLSGENTYTGPTTVSAGELRINGSTSASSAFSVQSGATLSGNGTINGSVTISNGGIINPGNDTAGTFSTGTLILNNSSVMNFELGASSDRVTVTGNLTLDGILNVTNTAGFDLGDYTLITCTGTITNNTLNINSMPLSSYNYSIVVNAGNVLLHVTSKEEMLPLTVVQAAPVCSVYTSKWTLVFDNSNGGGIKALTDSIHGISHGQGNQIGATQNLYFLEYNGTSSIQNGTWSVTDIGSFRATIRQSGALAAGIAYTTDYTIHGSGKIFIKSTINNSGSDVSAKIIRFACERSPIATMAVLPGNSSANQSPFVLLSSNASQQNDILLSIKDLWSASAGIPNSATGFYNSAATGYAGYECNNYSLASGQMQSWEFMIDFIHQNWNDTIGVGMYADDYRNPDSLVYIIGTPAMEQDWEQHLYGHWKFDGTGTVDTARDASANNHFGIISGGSWTAGKLENGIQLNGSQNITVQSNADFNGNDKFTVMAWIKPSVTISTGSVIIGKHNGTQGWKFTGDGSGRVSATLNSSTLSGKTTTIGTGSWHHVAVSWMTEGAVVFYVDGNVDKILSGSYTVTANSANLIIGSGFNGVIDDVRYYNDFIPENTLKSIYRNGIRSTDGVYDTRASNDNTLHVLIDGDKIPRRFPVFRIANYWATSKPAAGCVRLDGNVLTEGTDYFVDLHDGWNLLFIGLNRTIVSSSVRLFIDDANSKGSVVRSTPKMVSGKLNNGTIDYFWVKNFNDNRFGSASSKQWYVNWKMSENSGKDGEPWFMASSVTNPDYQVDTTILTNLLPGFDGYNDSWGDYCFQIGMNFPKSSDNVSSAFTYSIEESSSVRVVLRVNERTVNNGGSSFKVITRWTIYPTGQFFKWDSIYSFSAAPTQVYASACMDDTTFSSFYLNKIKKRGGVIYSAKFQDYAHAWLSMKNSSGYQAQPFDSDTILTWQQGSRVGLDFGDFSATSAWNSSSIQTVVYLDIQNANMNSAFIDSVANSAQYPQTPVMINGSLLSGGNATEGDLNGDGFNEREGAYVIKSNNNEVHIRLPAHGDTCRFKPILRITNYTSTSKPHYVIIYRGTDTVALAEGYHYNALLNRNGKELVIQIDSVFCDTTSIFISSDRTLAVKLSKFSASGGDRCDTLRWRTESEEQNLGYYIHRRICPEFMDSLTKVVDKEDGTGKLNKMRNLTSVDTEWVRINKQIISGAASGASYGPRDYIYIDKRVENGLLYEYKLIAVDVSNKEENYGTVKVMPKAIIPAKFMLFRNFPNPFRTATIIRFSLPGDCNISLNVYDLQGKLLKKLVTPDKFFQSGTHQIIWDGSNESGGPLAAGPYIYRLKSGRFADAKVMLLIN